MKKKGLGKGLDSLISTKYKAELNEKTKTSTGVAKVSDSAKGSQQKESSAVNAITKIKINLIYPNRNQPRKSFDEKTLNELADSIKKYGVIQPLVVRKKGEGYEIIAGERRYRAAKKAGLSELPVVVKRYNEQEVSEIALIENIQRENLNPIEEAKAYETLIKEYGLKQEELAERVSKSRSAITNHLRLLKLSEKVQNMLINGELSEGHARAILSLTQSEQDRMADTIIIRKLSVRETEDLIKRKTSSTKKTTKKVDKDYEFYAKYEDELREIMSTKTAIKREGAEKGKIVIDYYTLDELERLMEIFRKGNEA